MGRGSVSQCKTLRLERCRHISRIDLRYFRRFSPYSTRVETVWNHSFNLLLIIALFFLALDAVNVDKVAGNKIAKNVGRAKPPFSVGRYYSYIENVTLQSPAHAQLHPPSDQGVSSDYKTNEFLQFATVGGNSCAASFRRALNNSVVSMERKLRLSGFENPIGRNTYAVRFLTPVPKGQSSSEIPFADLVLRNVTQVPEDIDIPEGLKCVERGGTISPPLFDLLRVSSFAVHDGLNYNDSSLSRPEEADTCFPVKRGKDGKKQQSKILKHFRFKEQRLRAFRQYILHADMNLNETQLSFWSLIVRFGSDAVPDVRWKTLRREVEIQFSPRPSIAKVLENARFDSLESLCDHLLSYKMEVPALLRNFPFRSRTREYPVELLGEVRRARAPVRGVEA